MEANETKQLIAIGELANVLNVPKSWIYQRTAMGQDGIPHIKLGRYVRFELDKVLEFFKNNGQLVTGGKK